MNKLIKLTLIPLSIASIASLPLITTSCNKDDIPFNDSITFYQVSNVSGSAYSGDGAPYPPYGFTISNEKTKIEKSTIIYDLKVYYFYRHEIRNNLHWTYWSYDNLLNDKQDDYAILNTGIIYHLSNGEVVYSWGESL